ncbi:MBL fold metallo-hydrolase [Mesorhizobium sp. B2-4-17]|uniref:MBL fold metallo-hydrolase n=1 Tax=Mesorhizobium sp. B2-4-17 TaxID=2589932 RepID=UPI00112DFDC8|nr:MBL fold metallo-hydrolase [Mesorhizobium sp. B2-4-17]TPK91498.1 MBL fold metallo-hydrolase [Mesorhizobium sp. B2-4-17]
MSTTQFASKGDLSDKTISFSEIGPGLFAYTAEGDPNTGIIVGDDSCMVIDAQATPAMAHDVISRVRTVTDKPIKYVLLSHYHAVRVLGASAYGASEVVAHEATRKLIVERGEEDMASEIARFPRLFRGKESIPGLTWPSLTFEGALTLWLGKRRVEILHPGRGHTAGDTIAWVPDAGVLFSGDLIEYKSACYCGDAFLREWPATLRRLAAYHPVAVVPGRGDALVGEDKVSAAIAGTTDFVTALYGAAERAVAKGYSLKETFSDVRKALDEPFGDYAIYEHCLPFNVSRAYDEAQGIDWPRIWTDERDLAMWQSLQA